MSDLTELRQAHAYIADALFCSDLKDGTAPTPRQISAAIREAIKANRGADGCTEAVARKFAEQPKASSRRLEWCRRLAEQVLSAGDITFGAGGRA